MSLRPTFRAALIALTLLTLPLRALRAEPVDVALDAVDVNERSGQTIPLDLTFQNEEGETVRLGDYFGHGKPVVLNLGYYGCPMLCSMVLNGFVDALTAIELEPGRDFDIVTVSIDPKEKPALAKAKRAAYLEKLGKPGAAEGWHFHTGEEGAIQQLAEAVGFEYRYDEKIQQYAHPAVIFVLTEDGRVSRYLYGIQFKPKDLRLALLEASHGTIGTTVDRLLLFCYHFDPEANSYTLMAMNLMRLGGAVTLVLLAAFLVPAWIRSWRSQSAA